MKSTYYGAIIILAVISAGGGYLLGNSIKQVQEEEVLTPESAEEYLFVQKASRGDLVPIDEESQTYKLTLYETGLTTTYFANRPFRDAGAIFTPEFLELEGLFNGQDNPNASISLVMEENTQDVLVVELFNPEFDVQSRTLSYTITVLDEGEVERKVLIRGADEMIPTQFEEIALFIDAVPTPVNGQITDFRSSTLDHTDF